MRPDVRPSCPFNRPHVRPTKKHLSIFEIFSKNIQRICPVCPAFKGQRDISVWDVRSLLGGPLGSHLNSLHELLDAPWVIPSHKYKLLSL
jgi:hypothetical protein